jgi:hypothetical protein
MWRAVLYSSWPADSLASGRICYRKVAGCSITMCINMHSLLTAC